MKKHLYQFFVALIAISSFAFASCSDNDDDSSNNDGGTKININGVEYNVSQVSLMGSWNETQKSGEFTVSVDNESNGVIVVEYYTFEFSNATCPTVGDDVAQMNLELIPMSDDDYDLWDKFTYESGKAIVTETSPSTSDITIRFENLKMSLNGDSYVFDGTATLMFTY